MNKSRAITINVMAPLVVGDPKDINSGASQAAWQTFEQHLRDIKALGVEAVSTDVWWGLVEPSEGNFDWSYYDHLSDVIINAGLEWVPILSFHQCGGNIGDDVYVPLPGWIWSRLASIAGCSVRDLKYVSEQGNACDEYISAWATQYALPFYQKVMTAFRNHFAAKAGQIAEVNISLGPAGELRYPSYNSHDQNTDYPTRGALQCYSRLAVQSFHDWAVALYGGEDELDKEWGTTTAQGQAVRPPSNPDQFFKRGDHRNIQYGRDLFDWYSDSLLDHGRTVMRAALAIFAAGDSPMKGIDLGAKVPGVHWRTGHVQNGSVVLGDRLAELAAGLIRTSLDDWKRDEDGRGYRPLVTMFASLQDNPDTRVVLHFTCLEMPDGEGGKAANSVAASLVRWVGEECHRQSVAVKGENAVWWNLPQAAAWDRMRSHLNLPCQNGHYDGLTILRLANVVEDQVAKSEMAKTVQFVANNGVNGGCTDGD